MDIKKISGVLRAIGGSQRDKSYTSAIIAAAGLSRRFGGEVTKQMTELCGVPLLVHTLKAYEQADCIHEIVIVAREDEIPFWEKLCADHGISKVSRIVKGGETRQESVLNGLEATSPESRFVAIGDGARCLITPEQITEVCHAAYKYHAATAAHRATDTVKLANKRGFIESTTDRDTVWLAGTPQVFKTSLYRAAAYTALDKGIQATDDNALVEALGHRVRLVECGAQNIKITTKEDIAVAEGVLAHRAKMRAEAIADGNEV